MLRSIRKSRRKVALAAGLVVAAVTVLGGSAQSASAEGILPPANPAANISLPSSFETTGPCHVVAGGLTCQSPCFSAVIPSLADAFSTIDESPSCLSAALTSIDTARAAEGVGPMSLPSNWSSLTVAEQIFVVTNLERVDRGEPPLVSLIDALDTVAQAGAQAGTDPALPRTYGSVYALAGGAVWAGGELNPLLADYDWMYDDGWSAAGSNNLDCSGPGAAGCWGHRDIVLGAYTGTGCTTCVMGAGYTPTTASGQHLSYAAIIIRPAGAAAGAVFTWSQEQALLTRSAAASVTAAQGSAPAVGMIRTADGDGYWIIEAGGQVAAFGDASRAPQAPDPPAVGSAATPDGRGWWLVTSAGAVLNLGDAPALGGLAGVHLASPVVGMAATPDGRGYWLVTRAGGVFGFGDAGFHGSASSLHLGRAFVGMASTSDGKGYWLVARDGGVFGYGDTAFRGSSAARHLSRPVVGMATTPDGRGYWLVSSNGGVLAFGDAALHGSAGALRLSRPIVGMAATPDGRGYWLLSSNGGVFTFGDAVFHGSAA